jgi:RNA polymerase sigma factor (sigma-70 family)
MKTHHNLHSDKQNLDRQFTEIYNEFHDYLYAKAMQYAYNHHDLALDLFQETMSKAYRGLVRFDGRYPKAWLTTILKNTFLDHLKKQKSHSLLLSMSEIDKDTLQEESDTFSHFNDEDQELLINALVYYPNSDQWINILAPSISELMLDALKRLTVKYRVIFLLKYMTRLSCKEIAQHVSSVRSTQTVATYCFRAKNILSKYLKAKNKNSLLMTSTST